MSTIGEVAAVLASLHPFVIVGSGVVDIHFFACLLEAVRLGSFYAGSVLAGGKGGGQDIFV